MESTYISYSKAKISLINSTFRDQNHDRSSMIVRFDNLTNEILPSIIPLIIISEEYHVSFQVRLGSILMDGSNCAFDNPRGFAKTFRENWSVEMNTWKIGIGPEVKRGMEVGRYEVTWGCAAHKGSFAPVNPSGFIEPHRAWHGIPATLLYAMHQNTGGSQLSWTIPGILTFPSLSSLQNFPP